MAILGKGVIQIVADVSRATQGLKEAKGKADAVAAGLGKAGAALTAGVTTPILGAFTMAVNAASDLNEATNKLEVTFGRYGDAVKNALGDTVQNFGMARSAAYEAASTYGIFLKAAGLTDKQLSEMSPKLIQVAADMASFHNIGIDEALYKVRAALSGETEPLKAVGILMNDTLVSAQALKMGLVKADVDMVKVQQLTLRMQEAQEKYNQAVKKYGADSTQAQKAALKMQEIEQKLQSAMEGKIPKLTEQQKILARYALLMDQSQVFAGDFARTQSGVANSSRMLKQALQDLAAEFGTELLPIAQQFLQEAIKLVHWFAALPEPVKQNIIRMLALAAALGPLMVGISGVIKIGQGISVVVGWLSKLGGLASMAQTAGAATAAALGPVGWVILAVVAALALLAVAWMNDWGGIQEKTRTAVAWVKTQIAAAGTALQQLAFLGGYYLRQFAGAMQTALAGAVASVAAFVNALSGYWQAFVGALQAKWNEALTAVITITERIRAWATQKFQALVARIRAIFSINWGDIGRNIVSGIIGGIGNMAGALVEKMRGLAQNALSAAKNTLGIHSPSREMARLGQMTALGFLQGMQAGMPGIERMMGQTLSVKGGGRPVSATAGAGVGGAQPVQITIYNPKPEAAEDSVARAMKRLAYLGKP